MLVLALLMFFSAASRDRPIQKSMVTFVLGGALLYFADKASSNGIYPGDVPAVIYKFALMFF